MYAILWRFRPRTDKQSEFEAAYGPDGTWAEFFRTDEGYIGTELLRDLESEDEYVTIDRWRSREDYVRFTRERAEEYAALDEESERLTSEEERLGHYATVGRSLIP